ncbi:MAG: hypothetical protein RRY41_09470 [Burkholderiaceae bacterium]
MQQRISRIHVANYGPPAAWYEGITLDLTDPASGLPCDTILNLENGGGKTSLLSFIFSCIEPAQERFLKHIQDRNHRFVQYFAHDGRPGICLIEWEMPPQFAGQPSVRLVTGQAVSVRDAADAPDRLFFAFQARGDVSFDRFPAARLGSAGGARNMAEVMAWLQQSRDPAPDTYWTKVQSEWLQHLAKTRSIDVEMLRMQVNFSAAEGGMDSGFLTFRTETDFLAKFFGLTLDEERMASVRDSVVKACEQSKDKPKYERQRSELARLQVSVDAFVGAADHLAETDRQRQEVVARAARLGAALRTAALQAEADARAAAEQASDSNGIAREADTSAAAAQVQADALTRLQHEREVGRAQSRQDEAHARKQSLEDELSQVRGAQALSGLRLARGALLQIQELEADARQQLDPFRDRARRDGSRLRGALEQKARVAIRIADQDEGIRQAAQAQLRELQSWRTQLAQAINALSVEQSRLSEREGQYARQRRQLEDEGAWTPADASAAQASQRQAQRAERLEQEAREAELSITSLANEARARQRAAQDAAIEAERASQAAAQIRERIADGQAERECLSQDEVLRGAVEADLADPDSPALDGALAQWLAAQEAAIQQAVVRGAELELELSAIRDTGVAGRSADVDAVVDHLRAGGIRSARPFNTYLAEVGINAQQARQAVLADPARFLGVHVAAAELQAARLRLAESVPALSRPVVVSPAAVESSDRHAHAITVAPASDAAYNRAAAEHVKARLTEWAAALDQQQQQASQRYQQGLASREQLRLWRERFGASRLAAFQIEAEEFEAQAETAAERGERLQGEAAELETRAEAARGHQRSAERQGRESRNWAAQLARFSAELELDREARRARLDAISLELSDSNASDAAAARDAEALDQQRQHLTQSMAEQRSLAAAWRRERDAIDTHGDQDEATDADSNLELLQTLYRQSRDLLQSEESTRLGQLQPRLEAARADLARAERGFLQVAQGRAEADFESRLKLNFEQLIRELSAQAKHADEEERAALADCASARRALNDFQRGHPTLMEPPPEIIAFDDTALAAARQAALAAVQTQTAAAVAAREQARSARVRSDEASLRAERLVGQADKLAAAMPESERAGAGPALLPEDFGAATTALVSEFQSAQAQHQSAQRQALKRWQTVQTAAGEPGLRESEPQLAHHLSHNLFESACADRERLQSHLAERIAVCLDQLQSLEANFELGVGELYSLASLGLSLLKSAGDKRMPVAAPYVGGKPILKLRANFQNVPVETRRDSLRHFLTALIDTGNVPAKGAELLAMALVKMWQQRSLGIQVLKMTPDEEQQFVAVDNLKNSGGEGVTMAMFLYLLINQLRADTHAQVQKSAGGPLILDNPFAKATTPTLLRAQRMLAEAMGVQLIFATALPDYNSLGEFRRFIRLRRAGKHSGTGRLHIELAEMTLASKPEEAAI